MFIGTDRRDGPNGQTICVRDLFAVQIHQIGKSDGRLGYSADTSFDCPS
jgi:hypothetical protein